MFFAIPGPALLCSWSYLSALAFKQMHFQVQGCQLRQQIPSTPTGYPVLPRWALVLPQSFAQLHDGSDHSGIFSANMAFSCSSYLLLLRLSYAIRLLAGLLRLLRELFTLGGGAIRNLAILLIILSLVRRIAGL